jgi:hypothetical protein
MLLNQITQGDWLVDCRENCSPCIVRAEAGKKGDELVAIAECFGPSPQREANARLFSVSPKLLKACKNAKQYLTDPLVTDWLNRSGAHSDCYGKVVLDLIEALSIAGEEV